MKSKIKLLYADEVSRDDYVQMKKEFGFSNRDIAEITGQTTGSVKNQTRRTIKLATWAKTMAYMWKLNKIQQEEIITKKPDKFQAHFQQ